jgi:hypothetical protein
MSCVGKTTFSKQMKDHQYHCFDALFHWHLIEALGLSARCNLIHIKEQCIEDRFVLDGWHLSDPEGCYLPASSKVYVVYATYEQIVSQYRVKVIDPEEYRGMYRKWYLSVDYDKLPGVRYFLNTGEFVETDRDQFLYLVRT